MARWEPNTKLRLVRAALDLFGEQGYDNTTVAQIAERTGLTKTTFFRHFPDKREVLFAGQDIHAQLLTEGAAAAPENATPLTVVTSALDTLTSSFTAEQREFGPQLHAVVAATGELRERATFKHAGLTAALAAALQRRGVPELTAVLAAELGVLAFDLAFARWIEPANQRDFPDLARAALDELRVAATELD